MSESQNKVQAFVGDHSLTFVFAKSVAIQLGVGNREVFKYRVDGDRLILEKYHNPVTRQTIVMDRDGDNISSLVRSIRKKHANIEKISDLDWEEENQDSEVVF